MLKYTATDTLNVAQLFEIAFCPEVFKKKRAFSFILLFAWVFRDTIISNRLDKNGGVKTALKYCDIQMLITWMI